MLDFEIWVECDWVLSSWDVWDECGVCISLILGLEKVWTSLELKWEEKIARCDFWFCWAATSATALVSGRCSASPCSGGVRSACSATAPSLERCTVYRGEFLGFDEGF